MQLRGNGLSIVAALSEQVVQISSAILNCILLLLENLSHRLACLHSFSRGMRRSPQRVAQRASSFHANMDAPRLRWLHEASRRAWRQLKVLRLLHEASARRLQESLLRALQLQVTRRRLQRFTRSPELDDRWLHARRGLTLHLVNVAMTTFLKHFIRKE